MTSTKAQQAHLLRLLEHAHWANEEIFSALKAADMISEKLISLYGHLLSAEKVWLERLNQRDSSNLSIWPITRLEDCGVLIQENYEGYLLFLQPLEDKDLNTVIAYRNSKGAEFHTSIIDILSQVFLHGSYHRGQISSYLRLEGYEPVNTDFIMFTRTTSPDTP